MNESIIGYLFLALCVLCLAQCLFFKFSVDKRNEILLSIVLFLMFFISDFFFEKFFKNIYSKMDLNLKFISEMSLFLQFMTLFILYDFLAYWIHRIYHSNRFFWCNHIVHHSGEFFGIHLKLRESFISFLPFIIVYPLNFLGFKIEVILINFIVIFLIDTIAHINTDTRFYIIEKIFMTPYMHRIHHFKRKKEETVNYGNALILWDYLFGTFSNKFNSKEEIGISHFKITNNALKLSTKPYFDYFKKNE